MGAFSFIKNHKKDILLIGAGIVGGLALGYVGLRVANVEVISNKYSADILRRLIDKCGGYGSRAAYDALEDVMPELGLAARFEASEELCKQIAAKATEEYYNVDFIKKVMEAIKRYE